MYQHLKDLYVPRVWDELRLGWLFPTICIIFRYPILLEGLISSSKQAGELEYMEYFTQVYKVYII